MNRKQFRIVVILVLLIGGFGLAVYNRSNASWQKSASARGKVLGDFALNGVDRVTIKNKDGSLTLAKKKDAWVVEDRGDYPADFSRVKSLIQGLWELKPVQEVKVGPSQFARLDLVNPTASGPEAKENGGTLIELQGADAKPVSALLLGKKFLKKSAQDPDGEGFPVGRYVMPVTAQGAPVSLVSETLDTAEPKPEAWLDKEFLHISRIASVTVSGSTPELHWKLSRDNENAMDWKLADAKPEEKVDSAKLPSFPSVLGAPAFADVLPRGAKAEEPGTLVTVETFDHFTYTLRLGKPENDRFPVTVAVSAALPKERTPGKDEKPEDKKKLDEAFATDTKKLEEKLAREKQFETRVYLVAKSSLDPLLKSRADLLEVKKAEPSPTPGVAPAVSASPAIPVLVPAIPAVPAAPAAPEQKPQAKAEIPQKK